MRNPFLLALLGLAVVALVVGLLLANSLQTWVLGIGLQLLGGAALVGWLVAAALEWSRRSARREQQPSEPGQ